MAKQKSNSMIFSLMALMAVVIAAFIVLSYFFGGYSETQKLTIARMQATNIGEALQIYRSKVGRFPTETEGLAVLFGSVEGLPRKELDPWGSPWVYRVSTTGAVEFFSVGRDRISGTSDDVWQR